MESTARNQEPLDWRVVGGRLRLRFAMLVLLLIIIGLSGIGRRFGGWPIVSWPMYSRKGTPFPEDTAHVVELRARDTAGRVIRVFSPFDFLPVGSTAPIREVFVGAYDNADTVLRDQYREYILSVLGRSLPPANMSTIEAWRLEWDVEPLRVPPMNRSRPARQVPLGSFSAGQYMHRTTRQR